MEDLIAKITSGIARFFEKIRIEQETANHQLMEKRRVLSEYHQELIDGLPMVERFKMGSHRF